MERRRLVGNSLGFPRGKRGTDVYTPLPPWVAEALRNVPPGPNGKTNPAYSFWSGIGDKISTSEAV
jgi:hypothetical protein